MSTYMYMYIPWPSQVRPLYAPLRLCGPGPCGHRWSLVGLALVVPLGLCWLGPCVPPWALAGPQWSLMGPLWALLGAHGPGPDGPPGIYIDASAGIRSAGTSRMSGEPETLNATHKTDRRLHITPTKSRT